jgi:hypothetical protein
MARVLSRRGRVLSSRGRIRANTDSCRTLCCETQPCATVYRADSCIPDLPPVAGCAFTRPDPIYICTDTICDTTSAPIQPGNVVRVNGQCYQVQPGILLRTAVPLDAFLYDLPTVECFTNCDAPGCIPISPFSLAEPCYPACQPLYFCRSQFPVCRTIRVDRAPGASPTGPGCCYKFDPAAAPAFPPPFAEVCIFNGAPISPTCDVIDFGNQNTTTIGFSGCCECGDRGGLALQSCNHYRGGIGVELCEQPPELETCCPCPGNNARILIDYYYRADQLIPNFGQETTAQGVLTPTAPQTGCVRLPFSGFVDTVTDAGFIENGQIVPIPGFHVEQTQGPFNFQYCPLDIDPQLALAISPLGRCVDGLEDPNCDPSTLPPGIVCPFRTCTCLDTFYSNAEVRYHCICTFNDGERDSTRTEVRFRIRIQNPGPIPLGCEGGCMARIASLLGLPIPPSRNTLPFGIRGMVNTEEWL